MRQKISQKKYIIVGIVIIFLISLHYFGWLRPFESFIEKTFSPLFLHTRSFSVRIGDDYEFFKDRENFLKSFRVCQESKQNTQTLIAELAVTKQENEELRKQLAFKPAPAARLIVANVVGNDLNDTEKTIILNRGRLDGIVTGQAVLSGTGILVGKIIKTDEHLSFARLLHDNRSKVAATLLNKEGSLGVVEGGYGLSLRLKFIPRNETVHIGDQITTSGLENGFPRGLLIGTVAVIENEAYQPFQQAVIMPTVDLSKLTIVSVLTK
jgi:rod shape-determining protein MreC